MTRPPQGRDEPPSVAALAIQASKLRRDLDSLTLKLEDLTSTQNHHAQTLTDITQLREQIQQILTILDTENHTTPGSWFWLTMTEDEREAKLSELHDWTETVLREQYPDYLADHIKTCWPNHPEALWEAHLALPALDPHLPHPPCL